MTNKKIKALKEKLISQQNIKPKKFEIPQVIIGIDLAKEGSEVTTVCRIEKGEIRDVWIPASTTVTMRNLNFIEPSMPGFNSF